jgi:hypothetical protein
MQILRAFLEIEKSGPIYRGDDQDLLQTLTQRQRKEFAVSRHRLAKLSLQNPLEKDQIIKAFSDVFPSWAEAGQGKEENVRVIECK